MSKKSDYGNFIDTVNEISTIARTKGIAHLFTQDQEYNGREIHLTGYSHPLINFGSCSYLGLEINKQLKDAGADAIQKFGSQFSCSRTYLSCTPYQELESLLGKIFNASTILNVNSTAAHQSVIPIIIQDGDAVIFDQQAHISMQELKYKLIFNGITVDFLRHSRLDELQVKIDELSNTHNRIWYFLDGVYSMYGDLAPIHELQEMLLKNEKLHLYIDDAHAMSIFGKNGSGYILSQVEQHPRMILTVSLAKGFASAGGVTVFKNQEMYWRVKNWGGCLTFSGPQQPAVIAASIASAKIHLSDEIYRLQNDLMEKVNYCNELIRKYGLPLISESMAPIFFIGVGITKLGYNMVHRLMNDGLYVNIGIFPAVSERNTGIRFTVTNHHSKADLEKLIERIAFHLPLALEEEGRTMNDIYKAFRSVMKNRYIPEISSVSRLIKTDSRFKIQKEKSIKAIPQKLWDEWFGDKGVHDWNGLNFMETVFKNNPLKEDNWDFIYYIVRDELNKPVIATFLTSIITKDDMLASESKSKEIEERRSDDDYYMTSRTFMMGTQLTEGDQIYIDRSNSLWKNAMKELIDILWDEQEKQNVNNIFLRDFNSADEEMKEFLMDQGFVKVEMPASNYIDVTWNSREDYIKSLSKKNRKHLKSNVLDKESLFNFEIVEKATEAQIDHWYELYDNVRRRNLQINGFKLPRKLFQLMAESPDWDCMQFTTQEHGQNLTIGIVFAYKNQNYSNAIVGLDYTYMEKFETYRQSLFQTVVRAINLGSRKIYLGLTADFEKKKVGASSIQKVAFVQMKDTFSSSLMSLIPNKDRLKKLA
jgi:7-keto-8-aminopelargonate synthetase-like enzyme